MFWKTVLLLPCLVSAYLPPKKPVEQPVKTPAAGVSGSYGSIVGVQGSEINYGLVNSNLPAPAMNYGSIKQQPAAPVPVEAPVSEGAGQVAPAAYGSIKEASSAPPPPTPKPSKVPAPPVPQSYGAYASTGEQQSAVNPAQPPQPSNYGSINAAEVAYGQVTAQTAAAATPAPAPEQQTQAPPVAGYGATPVQPAYGAAAAQPQQPPPSGYAALPPTSAQQKPVEPETAAGSSAYESREIPKPQAAPVAPGGQYGGYMSLSMWKSKSKDDTVPKEQQTEAEAETETDAPNRDAPAEGTEDEQADEEATSQTPEEEQATTQDAEQQTEVDDQVDENKVVTAAPAPAPAPKACVDKNDYCDYWKTTGECEKNPAYMNVNCPKACGACKA